MAMIPTNEELMAYLYGELSEDDQKKIETWLKENPEKLKEVEELQAVRGVMGQVQDHEVVDPYFFSGKGSISFWQVSRIVSNTIIKPAIGLAAAISLMIIVGSMTGFQMNTQQGLSISFGTPESTTEQIDETQVKMIVQQMLESEKVQLTNDIESVQDSLKIQLAAYYDDQNTQLKNTLNNSNQMNNQAFADVVKQMQKDNLDYMERYLELSQRAQERNLQTALAELTDFLADQREEDLNRIQYNLTNLKETQDLQKIQTDQVLATIINTVNNGNNN